MTAPLSDVAVIGLGVMGANLARNFASRGLSVAVYNRAPEVAPRLAAAHPEAKFVVATELPALVASLARPRRIVLMVSAGPAVDALLEALSPLLDPEDIVVDAGNSLFADTDRRLAATKGRLRFVGMGVSGGSEGALLGPSIMPGGDRIAWERLRPVLEVAAARTASGPCVAHCGEGSAGHFVKMVHNGIEYGDMQLIAETVLLLRQGLSLQPAQVAATFERWSSGELGSYLVEITAAILRTADPEQPGALLLDAIQDRAGQKGTGRWTVIAAAELGVPIPTISAAVDARGLSSTKELRVRAEAAFGPRGPGTLPGITEQELAHALYAAKIASYTQGFALLAAGSEQKGYGTDLAQMARIWTGGCIIRATFLDRIREAFAARPAPELLALSPSFVGELKARLGSFRRVVAAATAAGHAIPGLAVSLAWLETLTTARGTAAVLQAQRDFFGSHTYERIDRPGVAVHTEWKS